VRSLELAIKYLAGERMVGTAAERVALTTAAIPAVVPAWHTSNTTNSTITTDVTTNDTMGMTNTAGSAAGSVGQHSWVKFKITDWAGTSGGEYPSWGSFQGVIGIDNDQGSAGSSQSKSTTYANWYFEPSNADGNCSVRQIILPNYNGSTQGGGSEADTALCSTEFGENSIFEVKQEGTTIYWKIDGVTKFTQTGTTEGDYYSGILMNSSYSGDNVRLEPLSSAVAAIYPNLSNGTIFEESDTGKHYMWNGTDTWNEIT